MRPGDVFFHNDVYLSEGGIGHLPDLCVTVPVFARRARAASRRWSRSCRHSGITTTSAAPCPARCRATRRSVFAEGLMVPPIRLWDAGVPNQAALTIMTRNSRMPESLAADLDAECSACLLGARRLGRAVRALRPGGRRGVLRRDRRQHHAHVPAGDPGQDPGRDLDLGGLRRARRRRRAAAAHPADHAHQASDEPQPRLILDFTGTGPQAKGPINHCRELRRRQLPRQVAGADPAQPRRHARSGWPSSTSTRASST